MEKLLRKQKVNNGEIAELLSPDGMMNEPWKSKFKKWTYKNGLGVNAATSGLIKDGVPGTPIYDLVSTDTNNGYINLYAEYNSTVTHDGILSAEDKPYDWTMMGEAPNKTYQAGEKIELADYYMYIFHDENSMDTTLHNCDECGGSGRKNGKPCSICDGTGRVHIANYYARGRIPTKITPESAEHPGLCTFTFEYGFSNMPEGYTSFKLPYDISISAAPKHTSITLLSDDFSNTFRYGSKLDLTDLSVMETMLDAEGNKIESKIYDFSDMTFDPVSTLTMKLRNSFDLSANFRSHLSSNITSSWIIPITVWSKVTGLSILTQTIDGKPAPPELPGRLAFSLDYLNTISCAGVFENGETMPVEDYTHLSVMNIPNNVEIIPEPTKLLKLCSCYNYEPIPEVSCMYKLAANEGEYALSITKMPTKRVYYLNEPEVDLTGIKAMLQYGSPTFPNAATVELTKLSNFTSYFTNFSPGKIDIPIYASYEFKNSGGNGTFPNWSPFTKGNIAFAETTISVEIKNQLS